MPCEPCCAPGVKPVTVLFQKRPAFFRKPSFEPGGAVAVIARPVPSAVQVATAAAGMGVLNFQQFKILFPIRAFLRERCRAITYLDPLNGTIFELPRFLHIALILAPCDGAAAQ